MDMDDEFFEDLDKELGELLGEDGAKEVKEVAERWWKIAQLIPAGESVSEPNWLMGELEGMGIPIRPLMLLGMKLALAKNVPAQDFVATWISGFVFGWFSALEHEGQDVIDDLLARKPGSGEPEEDLQMGVLQIETRQVTDQDIGIERVGKHMRETARSLGETFTEPDDDWVPIIVAVSDKEVSLITFEISDEKTKGALFSHVIPQALKRTLPPINTVAFIVSAWTLERESAEGLQERMAKGQLIADHPERIETLMLYVMDKGGASEMWTAKILRDDEHPPGLDEWKNADVTVATGRVSDMLRKILA